LGFWSDHSAWFLAAFVACPRLFLLYTGGITPGAIGPIAGFVIAPRIMLAASATSSYWGSDPVTVGILWVVGVAFDVITNIAKISAQRRATALWKENLHRGSNMMRSWY
jgi:hypothetical protein